MAENNTRDLFPQDQWKEAYSFVSSMKILSQGDKLKTVLKVEMTCGCGNKFIEKRTIDGPVPLPEAELHLKSLALLCHRRFSEDEHQPQNPEAEADES